ncbi:MAG: FAD-dependent oxidoreductase [Candidatus Riflebacteria bacterium]|nr:FAD-dependent oxidoreductase [Candidatus Riflebacteria bacterium]
MHSSSVRHILTVFVGVTTLVQVLLASDVEELGAVRALRQRAGRDARIAVIGAGTSGVTAVHALQKKGYRNITLYEGEDRIGGKVHSVVIDGRQIELGAVLGAKGTPTIYRMARELGILKMTPFAPTVLVALKNGDGSVKKVPIDRYWGGHSNIAVARGLLQLSRLVWLSRFKSVFKPGFYNLDPDLVGLTMTEFAKKHRFDSVLEPAHVILYACGYGSPDEVPALYLMKMMKLMLKVRIRQDLTFHMDPGFYTFDGGYQKLWEKIGEHLVKNGLDLRLSSWVQRVVRRTRADGSAEILVTANGRTDVYDRLLITVMPKQALGFLDATGEERAAFSKVSTFDYHSVVFRARGLEESEWVSMRYNMTRARDGHLFSYYNDDPGSGVFTGYQFSRPDAGPEELDRLVRQDVAELGGTVTDIVVRKPWTYFPHVKLLDLATDTYPRLNALQGQLGTYYLGGLFAFESTDYCAEFAEFVVNQY